MKYKLFIFDFDGTLADSFPWVMTVIDEIAEKYKLKKVERRDIEAMRKRPPKELIKDQGIPFWKIPSIGRAVRSAMARDIHQVPMFEGVDRLLRELSAQGAMLALVSSNSYENVCRVLGPENMALLEQVECGISIFGKDSKFKKVLKKFGVSPEEALCIGDEIRDIEAARKAGIPFGAVAWGYTDFETLKAMAPEEMFQSFDEMFELIA